MSDTVNLLVVDDDAGIRATLSEYFSENEFQVHEAENGSEMRRKLDAHPIALVLLDLKMPGEDGFTLCRHLRENFDVGIVMLTGSRDSVDKVIGLELGADDYVAKPFDLRELLARVRSVLRRVSASSPTSQTPETNVRNFGNCVLNVDTHELKTAKGEDVVLGAMEFDLLHAFIENPNRVLSRDQLLSLAHGRDWDVFDRSIDVRVTRLRKKIEDNPSKPRHIRTVRGTGYIFSPDGG